MEKVLKIYTPHIRISDSVTKVMTDVVLALLPAIIAAYMVYGIKPVFVIITSVISALLSEYLFSALFFKKHDSIKDISGVVTGILLGLTLAPFTPLYVVAFGASAAVIFGKLVYSGLGRNMFNPALVGREFMTVFFPTVMSSGAIWFNQEELRVSGVKFFSHLGDIPLFNYLDKTLLNPSGAIGEFSVFFLVIGGVYLLLRDRISWHIPVSLFLTVFFGYYLMFILEIEVSLSMGGLMLAGIFMATDMPSSPSNSAGKIYYGIMTGVAVIICWYQGIRFETLSYSILVLNAFTQSINYIFRPKVFGKNSVLKNRFIKGSGLTLIIGGTVYILTLLHHAALVSYLIYIYIFYTVIKLILSNEIK
ncbi:electron transporter [Leptotrichia sp. OH3620_COT-345]|uniref:RnfABCDGE type electron transport complex subunit D n=1 Tax=Leptotrichia sp. OH3620_COT-345 TaxID=2491048 RepID=UPI000F651ABF|nr:RnfABCDGE type electron transport complex subunit D [Leptotrichia sp. OH3620_COT-345]RRD40785.1 electron transporter [Leptotrichia sp. OH3620_COT-345]